MKRINLILLAASIAVCGNSFANSEYFTIHAKNMQPVYTPETIQIEGVAPQQTTTPAAIKTTQETINTPVQAVSTPKVETPVQVETPALREDIKPAVAETQNAETITNVEPKEIVKSPLSGSVEQTEVSKVHFGKSLSNYQAAIKFENLGNNLVRNASLTRNDIKFNFSNEATINAYAVMSGEVVVFRGLLDYCELEDELAFVVGHELSHLEHRDSLKQNITNIAIDAGGSVGAHYAKQNISSKWAGRFKVAGYDLNQMTDKAVGTVQNAASAKYSRMHESRADQKAIDYVVKSGYNPLAGISIMFKIGDNYQDLFEDHPSTEKRLQNMYDYIAKKYPQYISKGFPTEAYKQACLNIQK